MTDTIAITERRPRLRLDRLSTEDTHILKLGRNVIRGHTGKVMVLQPGASGSVPGLEDIRRHVASRLHRAPRMRQRVVETPLRVANPVWLDDPEFDIARHITAIPAAGPVGRAELQEHVARRMEQRLDCTRPLWHLDVIERLEHGGTALIWRLHHCLADGTTSVRLASQLLWDTDPAAPTGPIPAWEPQAIPPAIELLARGLADRVGSWSRPRQRASARVPLRQLERVLTRELRREAKVTPLAAQVSCARAVGFASAPFSAVHRAGKAIGAEVTVNDVVLAIVAGAIANWLPTDPGVSTHIRVKIPVSLHRADEPASIANHDSFFFVELPVTEPDPVERVRAISAQTQQRKHERDAEILYRLGVHSLVARWAMSPRIFTFNVSNVPGPRQDVYIMGAPVHELYSLAEVAHRHALRVAVISTADRLFFGLNGDAHAVKDMPALTDALQSAVDELVGVAA